jgi:hypothetical protein
MVANNQIHSMAASFYAGVKISRLDDTQIQIEAVGKEETFALSGIRAPFLIFQSVAQSLY